MIDFIAYLEVQRRTNDLAREALPGSPVAAPNRSSNRGGALRHRLSDVLRRLADGLEPAADGRRAPASGGC